MYDLSRDPITTLAHISNAIHSQRWINDYAVGVVIAKLKEQLAEFEKLISLQHKRSVQAIEAWQKAHNKPDVWPDLGELLAWLMKEVDIGCIDEDHRCTCPSSEGCHWNYNGKCIYEDKRQTSRKT